MILSLALFACAPDDVTDDTQVDDTAADTDTDTDADTDADTDTDIGPGDMTGEWVSQGDDISPLFQTSFFDYTRIDASFGGDGSYTVSAMDADGATYDFVGTYTVDTRTTPGTIVLTQSTPYVATSEGIWQVDGGVLTYEVVQTSPDYGYSPPTPEAGFGSTSGPNLTAGVNIQTYRRP